jgi:hypothetical protein
MVRAKFRVMEIGRHWNGQITSVKLLPVGPKGDCYPDGCEENAAFWQWTPSGEMSLVYGTTQVDDVPFELGHAYYVDMSPAKGRWKLEVNSEYEDYLDIKLSCKWQDKPALRSGAITMSIMNKPAWPAFQNAGPGSSWDVEFTPAPG